jgi:hypothetical protein
MPTRLPAPSRDRRAADRLHGALTRPLWQTAEGEAEAKRIVREMLGQGFEWPGDCHEFSVALAAMGVEHYEHVELIVGRA